VPVAFVPYFLGGVRTLLRKSLFAGLSLILLLMAFSCAPGRPGAPPKKAVPAPEPPGQLREPRQVSITIAAMGDFLMHLPVVYSVRDPHTGRFEFGKIFRPVHLRVP